MSALDQLADTINVCFSKSDNYRITAGKYLLEARQRVRSGEAGLIKWERWVAVNIKRSLGDVRKCLALATAEDPEAAAEEERRKAREAMREHRSSRAPPEPDPQGDYANASAFSDRDSAERPDHAVDPLDHSNVSVPAQPDSEEHQNRANVSAVSELDPVERPDPVDTSNHSNASATSQPDPEEKFDRCGFCLKSANDAELLIPGVLACICDQCAEEVYKQMKNRKIQQSVNPQPPVAQEINSASSFEIAEDEAILDRIRAEGRPWMGPAARERLGIDEEVVERLLGAGRLRQHPEIPGNVAVS